MWVQSEGTLPYMSHLGIFNVFLHFSVLEKEVETGGGVHMGRYLHPKPDVLTKNEFTSRAATLLLPYIQVFIYLFIYFRSVYLVIEGLTSSLL